MGRFGDPEKDIGRVCVQIAGPDFKCMSGETLTLEGGMGQRPQLSAKQPGNGTNGAPDPSEYGPQFAGKGKAADPAA